MNELMACKTCGLVQEIECRDEACQWECVRCGEVLEKRHPADRRRTMAFALAALFLYVPANIYPMITMQYLGRETDNTVWGGVRTLYQDNMWPIAVLVFCASILVPLLKLMGLLFLVTNRSPHTQRLRTSVHKIIGSIGPWAMLDVFLLAVMVALIRFGRFATVVPGPGIFAFSAVVIFTMLASASFDPHLIWMESPSTSQPRSKRE
jgi:paraquat-inducible protein A